MDENKDRVLFYMSVLTTRKLEVRGKSVDFRNREGSSPSIPKKVLFDYQIIYILFSLFVNRFQFLIFLIQRILFQNSLEWIVFLYSKLSLGIEIIHIEMNIFFLNKTKDPLELVRINNPNHYLDKVFRSIFNWHSPNPFSKVKKSSRRKGPG